MIFSIRITAGQEHIVADMLANKARALGAPLAAVAVFPEMRGYIFIEMPSLHDVREFIKGVRHIKGALARAIGPDELSALVEIRAPAAMFAKGDVVEFISGPFKGERARIIKLDPTKEALTVELLEAPIPVPVTAKADAVKLIQKAEKAEREGAE